MGDVDDPARRERRPAGRASSSPDFPWWDRDQCRTPMPWTAGPGAGFTTGRPWLRLGAGRRDAATSRRRRPTRRPSWRPIGGCSRARRDDAGAAAWVVRGPRRRRRRTSSPGARAAGAVERGRRRELRDRRATRIGCPTAGVAAGEPLAGDASRPAGARIVGRRSSSCGRSRASSSTGSLTCRRRSRCYDDGPDPSTTRPESARAARIPEAQGLATSPTTPRRWPRRRPASITLPEEVVAQDHQLKLYYAGKSSEGVRMRTGPNAIAELPAMLARPRQDARSRSSSRCRSSSARRRRRSAGRPRRCSGSTPTTSTRRSPGTRWSSSSRSTRSTSPSTPSSARCSTARSTRPATPSTTRSSVASPSHWDEATGDMIVRAVVGWGGKGVRGDTDRIGAKLLVGHPHEHPGQPVRAGPDRDRAAGAGRRSGRPRLRPLRLRVGPRAGVLLPEVRHAPAARLTGGARRPCRSTTTSAATAVTGPRSSTGSTTHGPTFCPVCGAEGTMTKAFTAPTIHFKGSGWAKKDRSSSSAVGRSSTIGRGRDERRRRLPASPGSERRRRVVSATRRRRPRRSRRTATTSVAGRAD